MVRRRREIEVLPVTAGGGLWLGQLFLPHGPRGSVIVLGGSGCACCAPGPLIEALTQSAFAALLIMLPGPGSRDAWGAPELTQRLREAALWLKGHALLGSLPSGLLGMGQAAAAALNAAASPASPYEAVVACEGGAEMAESDLDGVHAPTLFLARRDPLDFDFQEAMSQSMLCESAVERVDTAAPGKASAHWFLSHFSGRPRSGRAYPEQPSPHYS